MSRSVPEWIAVTPDTPVPDRVRVRVFEAKGGCCHACGRKIRAGDKWTCEHLVALINGGENREGNLGVTCLWCLPGKNSADVAEKSRVYKRRRSHLGIKKRRTIRGWRKFDGSPVLTSRQR